jgi:hypothetical protein
MGRDRPEPLSIKEAKYRLRVAARQSGPSAWVRRHPLDALGIALLGGFITAHLGDRAAGTLLPVQKLLLPLLFGMIRQR